MLVPQCFNVQQGCVPSGRVLGEIDLLSTVFLIEGRHSETRRNFVGYVLLDQNRLSELLVGVVGGLVSHLFWWSVRFSDFQVQLQPSRSR